MMKRVATIGLFAFVFLVAWASDSAAQKKALLIGNSNYEPKCSFDFPTVPGSVAAVAGPLGAAGYAVTTVADRNGLSMRTDVESNVPADTSKYVIFYAGLGEPTVGGALVGPDCTRMTAQNLFDAAGTAISHTLVILESCASGDFADALNALDPSVCTITASTGSACPTEGVFSPCFAQGLTGAADTNGNGMVTVAEAAAYAIANCGDGITAPTWDGDCADCVIGVGTVSVESGSWGSTKASYR